MSGSLCCFVPPAAAYARVEVLHFVYETELYRLRQPFCHAMYRLFLVEAGSARLVRGDAEHPISCGSLFFTLPEQEYYLRDAEDLVYTYIAFRGEGAEALLAPLAIGPASPPVDGLTALCGYFAKLRERLTTKNAALLSESALLYALAALTDFTEEATPVRGDRNLYGMLLDCAQRRFTDPDLSLASLGLLYSYSEKYLSALFKKHMGVGFSAYLSDLRISHARRLLEEGEVSVSAVARASGFRDPLYFSKVFRRFVGMSPTEYRARAERDPVLAFTRRYTAGGSTKNQGEDHT